MVLYDNIKLKYVLTLCLFPSNVLFFSISSFNNCLSISMILEKVRNKWIFLFSPNQSCQILYQFLFNDHVLCTSIILIPLFQSTLSSTHQCLFVISSHFYLLLLSQICNIQILTMFLCNFGSCLILSIFNYSNLLFSYYFNLQYQFLLFSYLISINLNSFAHLIIMSSLMTFLAHLFRKSVCWHVC